MTAGEMIKKLRKDKGMSQEELAEIMTVGQPYISSLERDIELPSQMFIRLFCKFFSLDEHAFYEGDIRLVENEQNSYTSKMYMEKETAYLEYLLGMQEFNLNVYSKDVECLRPREGFEKEWQEVKDKIAILIRIMKAVRTEQLSLNASDKNKVATVVERLLNESATAYVKTSADSTEVRVFDGGQQKTIATFEVEIGGLGALLFKKFQFY